MKNNYKSLLITVIICFIIIEHLKAQTCPGNIPSSNNCEEPTATSLSDKTIKICRRCHFGSVTGVCVSLFCNQCIPPISGRKRIKSDPTLRILNFSAFFLESTIYYKSDLALPGDVGDMNKLMRIYSTKPCDNDQFYLGLGWRYRKSDDGITTPLFTQEGMELALYSHVDHRDQSAFLAPICNNDHPGRIIITTGSIIPKAVIESNNDDASGALYGPNVELVFSSKGYFVKTYRRGVAVRRRFTEEDCPFPTPSITKVRRDAYFGGDNCAPRTMKIRVGSIEIDHSPTWWTDSDYKGYAASEFYSGENVTIYAKNEVDFTPVVLLNQTNKTKNTIKSGANVTIRVGTSGTLVTNALNNPVGVVVEIGANVDARPLNPGEPAPANTGLNITFAGNNCTGGSKWSGEDVGNEEDLDYEKQNNPEIAETYSFTIYPNPFSSNININFTLSEANNISIALFDIYGQKIEQVKRSENYDKGTYQLEFTTPDLPSGIYFITLQTNNNKITKKMMKVE